MAATDKDIEQKKSAIQFCVSVGMIPFYEVDVTNVTDFGDKPETLTDIDVIGVYRNNYRTGRVAFDCKTSKTSPINRAFWAAGIANYISAAESYVILKRAAPESHRVSAKSMRVHLFDESQFKQHAQALSFQPIFINNYLTDMDRWHGLHAIFKSNFQFERLGTYLRQVVPLDVDSPKIVRGIIANLRQAKGEFDPEKLSNLAVFFYSLMGFSLAMSTVVQEVFNSFDPKQSKEEFENFLRDYIWGGRESYQLRKKLQEALAAKLDRTQPEFDLNAWEDFIALVRSLIDSPESVFLCCLPLAGCSLRALGALDMQSDMLLKEQLSKNNRQRQFIFGMSKYLVAASGLPKDMDEKVKEVINQVMG
ncbi:hypothetical protein GWQ43_07210 [Alcaligenes faecalis]|uniref:hypothetical protein n=1 Tax=Alcaligenes faecalis TaxID=511 RepID=UPI00137C0C1E|nr:hypothetical protein [Alcaligenes faecalis]QHS35861.1 hypothetical protein GWQ43_07210 [Alcaligenes faecalis]